MAGDFGTLNKKFDQLASEFDGRQLRKSLEVVGRETKGDIVEAVRGDLGDNSMSGWRRGKPVPLVGRYDIVSDHEIDMTPAPRARGPLRVLEEGRNANAFGNAFGAAVAAFTAEPKLTKSGKRRKQRAKKVKRWNGVTQGKGTWSDASELMERRVPIRIRDHIVLGAMTRTFGKR